MNLICNNSCWHCNHRKFANLTEVQPPCDEDMKHASPATVSRGGVLFINETDIGWRQDTSA
eukprot:4610074-Amphidinium_carterae.1